MFYRTAGQFKTSYKADMALFPVRQDAVLLAVILALVWGVFPLLASEFAFQTLLIPILIYALAALGLNILTGYAGQLSLGTGAFMGVGAYACYKMVTLFPWMNPVVAILLSGLFSAGVGVMFGIPSLRIKGFYLAIATLAAQFFLVWLFEKWGWLYNDNASGAIQVPNLDMFGIYVAGPQASSLVQYYVVLAVVTLMTLLCINLTRGNLGRTWKATRDMDIAAELIGINLLRSKLMAFAVSSYVVGVAGALFVFMWRGAAVRHPAQLPGAVHRHHRRAGIDPWQLSGGDPDRGAAGGAEHAAAGAGAADQFRHGGTSERDDRGRADRVLPDHRTARAGPALGADPRKAYHLALPALRRRGGDGHHHTISGRRHG